MLHRYNPYDIQSHTAKIILNTLLVISVADMPGGDSYNILCFTMSNLLLLVFPLK